VLSTTNNGNRFHPGELKEIHHEKKKKSTLRMRTAAQSFPFGLKN
jgi:hypothetical protein